MDTSHSIFLYCCTPALCPLIQKPHAVVKLLLFQFHDGVYLVLLMGLLEGYFVPLYSFHLTPDAFDQKVITIDYSVVSVKVIVVIGCNVFPVLKYVLQFCFIFYLFIYFFLKRSPNFLILGTEF